MSNSQIRTALESYLAQLDQLQQDLLDSHMKFRIALTDTLKLLENESLTLKRLQGAPNALKGYIIKLNEDLCESTKNAFESLRKGLEPILDLA